MKKIIFLSLSLTFILFAFAGQRGNKVAIVKIKKGSATVINTDGSNIELKKGDWIEQGSVVKTSKRSFVKLSFIDKSTVNVGPSSEMKIEKFSKNEAGVLNVISGKIRSKVSKNYLNMKKNRSKLFVKSKSAVMGIRGTDFVFTTNKKTGASTAVLFEGSVVFNKLNKKNKLSNLEAIVNKGYRIKPGQFSVSRFDLKKPTVPSKLSSKQFKALEKNESFIAKKKTKNLVKKSRSITPEGLSGETVSSNNSNKASQAESYNKSKGFVQGDRVKPVDGSIVHIDSGTIIPIGSDAVYDSNSKEWVSSSTGTVDSLGSYVPPKSFTITDDGKLLKEIGGQKQFVNLEIKPLNEVPSFDKIETVGSDGKPLRGPSPASTNKNNKEGGLDLPPVIQGEETRPPGSHNAAPPGPNNSAPSGKTRVRANINK